MNPPFTNNMMLDAGLATIVFFVGAWLYFRNGNKWGIGMSFIALIWAWRLFSLYY